MVSASVVVAVVRELGFVVVVLDVADGLAVLHPTLPPGAQGQLGGQLIDPQRRRVGPARTAVPGRSRESLKALADVAGSAGIRLAVENTGGGGRPGSTMASILEMIDGLGGHVGLCMGTGHSQQAHLDLLDELSMALSSGKLFPLHLHDVDSGGKDHYIPGEGCIDFDPYLERLRAHGYDRGRTLEIAVAPAEGVALRVQQAAAVRDQWQEAG